MKQFGKRKNERNKTELNTKCLCLWKYNLDKMYVVASTKMNSPLFARNSYDYLNFQVTHGAISVQITMKVAASHKQRKRG